MKRKATKPGRPYAKAVYLADEDLDLLEKVKLKIWLDRRERISVSELIRRAVRKMYG